MLELLLRRQDEVPCAVDPDIFNEKLRTSDVLLVDLKSKNIYFSLKHDFLLANHIHYLLDNLKMLGLYLYNLIIGHKSVNMLSILNK